MTISNLRNSIREVTSRTINFTHMIHEKPDPMSFWLAGTSGGGCRTIDGPPPLSEEVKLLKEPLNAYDSKAVAVYLDGIKMGYVPRPTNQFVWFLTDDHRFTVTKWDIDHPEFPHIQVTMHS